MSIDLKNVDYVYDSGEPFEYFALRGISLRIDDGAFVGIVGRTGSGKSTLVEHLNGLLFSARGDVIVDDEIVSNERTVLAKVRRRVGIVFQYPEDQFFAETIFEEVAFGCRNYGFSKEQVDESVHKAMSTVGLDPERFLSLSPFQLSGENSVAWPSPRSSRWVRSTLYSMNPPRGSTLAPSLAVLTELESLRQTANVTVILGVPNAGRGGRIHRKQVVAFSTGTKWRSRDRPTRFLVTRTTCRPERVWNFRELPSCACTQGVRKQRSQ